MSNFPNFIGIGGQKCASTWLSECLRCHPEIFMSSPKELKYFSTNAEKGFDWYLKFFSKSSNFKYRGEFSSNYIYHVESAKKIKNKLGNVKVIAVVRDPVERSLSHIKHLIRDGKIRHLSGEISLSSFKDLLVIDNSILSNSFYQPGLNAYLSVFGKDSLFIVSQDKCKFDGELVLQQLWKFFNVDNSIKINIANKVISKGINPKYFFLETLRIKVFILAKYRFPWLINIFKRLGLSSFYRKINQGDLITFSNEVIEYIRNSTLDDWIETKKMLSVI